MTNDIIFIGGKCEQWRSLKERFPTAKRCSDFFKAQKMSMTKMFWAVWDDVIVADDFDFSYQADEWSTDYVHVFKNGDSYDGIVLCGKRAKISKNEVDDRFFANKKEVDIKASEPRLYDVFEVDTYDDYLKAVESSTTEMFWIVWPDVQVNDDFEFNYRVPKWEERHDFVRVFKNGKHFDGIVLVNKHRSLSKREIQYRCVVNKKEVDIQASVPVPYEVFNASSYDDYLSALENTKTSMFWVVPPDVQVNDDFDFSYHVPRWDERYVHIFRNDQFFDGVCLFSKENRVSKNEFNYRTFMNKKEVDVNASTPLRYDVVFISYYETNADENYQRLLEKRPDAKRVDKVQGIHQAHIKAAELCTTPMFWVVDGDAELVSDFNFDYQVPKWEQDTVHVWRSKNPINGLTYGYGGVKLLPLELTKCVDVKSADMTTSISHKFKAVEEVSNVTAFNTDPFSTWRSAFRECAKLASKSLRGQIDEETQQRLDAWCNTDPDFAPYSAYARRGAIHGCEFGLSVESSVQLGKINDFDWLYEIFLEENKNSE